MGVAGITIVIIIVTIITITILLLRIACSLMRIEPKPPITANLKPLNEPTYPISTFQNWWASFCFWGFVLFLGILQRFVQGKGVLEAMHPSFAIAKWILEGFDETLNPKP